MEGVGEVVEVMAVAANPGRIRLGGKFKLRRGEGRRLLLGVAVGVPDWRRRRRRRSRPYCCNVRRERGDNLVSDSERIHDSILAFLMSAAPSLPHLMTTLSDEGRAQSV